MIEYCEMEKLFRQEDYQRLRVTGHLAKLPTRPRVADLLTHMPYIDWS